MTLYIINNKQLKFKFDNFNFKMYYKNRARNIVIRPITTNKEQITEL